MLCDQCNVDEACIAIQCVDDEPWNVCGWSCAVLLAATIDAIEPETSDAPYDALALASWLRVKPGDVGEMGP